MNRKAYKLEVIKRYLKGTHEKWFSRDAGGTWGPKAISKGRLQVPDVLS